MKTSNGDVPLKLTKKAIYDFERDRGSGFLSAFADVGKNGEVRVRLVEVMNTDIQVNLARVCQVDTALTVEEIVEIAVFCN